MGKVITNIESAFEHLEDGMTILAGGFGLCGIPEHSIAAIQARGTKRLTVVSNNCCLLYTSPSPRDATLSRMPSSA